MLPMYCPGCGKATLGQESEPSLTSCFSCLSQWIIVDFGQKSREMKKRDAEQLDFMTEEQEAAMGRDMQALKGGA